jgi:hypothetical protein
VCRLLPIPNVSASQPECVIVQRNPSGCLFASPRQGTVRRHCRLSDRFFLRWQMTSLSQREQSRPQALSHRADDDAALFKLTSSTLDTLFAQAGPNTPYAAGVSASIANKISARNWDAKRRAYCAQHLGDVRRTRQDNGGQTKDLRGEKYLPRCGSCSRAASVHTPLIAQVGQALSAFPSQRANMPLRGFSIPTRAASASSSKKHSLAPARKTSNADPKRSAAPCVT